MATSSAGQARYLFLKLCDTSAQSPILRKNLSYACCRCRSSVALPRVAEANRMNVHDQRINTTVRVGTRTRHRLCAALRLLIQRSSLPVSSTNQPRLLRGSSGMHCRVCAVNEWFVTHRTVAKRTSVRVEAVRCRVRAFVENGRCQGHGHNLYRVQTLRWVRAAARRSRVRRE
jgi:hypothetical protein